ncbi:Kinesin light chain [Paramuricea clavata]|uniref:Kinesin light chain n=1 Tax=Paramuricea clavata TaxID=317549 RepID=A0A7D9HCY9_PARCT|nr:Kinesin light chain [Paramuricea clavata]
MSLPWYNNEETNYACLRKIVTDVVSEGLRIIFKQEWNNRYQTTIGAWDDTLISGTLLYNREYKRKGAKNYLPKFQNGNTKEWDCTTICDAILFSNCIGKAGLNPSIYSEVYNLRDIRNKVMHPEEGKLSDLVFEDLFKRIRKSFHNLALSVKELDEIKTERKRFCSFQVLPPKPTHDVISRTATLLPIINDLHKLFSTNDGKLTYLYIYGNPGSGKSQLARQIGQSHYNDVIQNQSALTFVMTINGKSLATLLESYKDFTRRLNCVESIVSNIISSKETTKEEKIRLLRTQICTRIKTYKSWLIIVDNVEDLKLVTSLLPQLKDEEWNGGQVLITTQDGASIPPNASCTKHVSVSEGMGTEESCSLLASLSGIGDRPILAEVAKQLDYQPLALAAAAVYVKQVIELKVSPGFSWHNYLKKLEAGKRKQTEQSLRDINTAYSLTMTTAVLLAVEKFAESDKVLRNIFHFLSLSSHESLPLEVAINYVLLLNQDLDEEQVGIKIRKCSLILSEDQELVCIRLHRVVHDAFKVYASNDESEEVTSSFEAAARSFFLFKGRKDERSVIPHLNAFNTAVTNKDMCFSEKPNSEISKILSYFGCVSDHYGELSLSKLFHVQALEICKKLPNPDHILLAELYSHLGCVHYHLGDLQQAKQYDEHTLTIRMEKLGSRHIDVATAYNNLGTVYRDLGDLQQAKQHHELALEIRIEKLGPNHNDVAASYNNLGKVYHDLRDLPQAKQFYERALTISIKELGSRDIHVATANKNLGNVYRDLGNTDDLQKAKQHHKHALEILIENLGLRHIRVATAYKNLGNVHLDLGDLHQAKKYSELALDILIEKLGLRHIRVATAYNDLGEVHRALGDLQQAKLHHQEALAIRIERLESTHPLTATSYDNLGRVCEDLRELQQAKECRDSAMVIRKNNMENAQ